MSVEGVEAEIGHKWLCDWCWSTAEKLKTGDGPVSRGMAEIIARRDAALQARIDDVERLEKETASLRRLVDRLIDRLKRIDPGFDPSRERDHIGLRK